MEDKTVTRYSVMAFATYRPKPGNEKVLMQLVKDHLPTLHQLGLVTERPGYLARSTDGTIVQVFEWKSMEAIEAAHKHPTVSEMWEKIMVVAEFPPMNSLPESSHPFAGFEIFENE